MRNIVIYHSIDWDGWMSAAVAGRGLDGLCDYAGWNYGKSVPDTTGYDNVYLLDVRLPDEDMVRICETSHVTWIDHHKGSLETVARLGLRCDYVIDESFAACILTFRHFFYGKEIKLIPRAVLLIGEYDIFNKSGRFEPWDDILAFQLSLRLGRGSVELADKLYEMSFHEIEDRIQDGRTLLMFKRQEAMRAWKTFGIEIQTPAGQRGLLMLTHDKSSLMTEYLFDIHENEHDLDFVLMANIIIDTPNLYSVSARVPEYSDFSAYTLASIHGGGGHEKAAGFTLTAEEIQTLINTRII